MDDGGSQMSGGWAQPGSITCLGCDLQGLRLRVGAQGPVGEPKSQAEVLPQEANGRSDFGQERSQGSRMDGWAQGVNPDRGQKW